MWTVYKREIIARQKQDADFLKNFYNKSKERHRDEHGEEEMGGAGKAGEDKNDGLQVRKDISSVLRPIKRPRFLSQLLSNGEPTSLISAPQSLDYDVQLDSDEEAMDILELKQKHKEQHHKKKEAKTGGEGSFVYVCKVHNCS